MPGLHYAMLGVIIWSMYILYKRGNVHPAIAIVYVLFILGVGVAVLISLLTL